MDRMLWVITVLVFGGTVGFVFNWLTGNIFLSFGMGFVSIVIVFALQWFGFYLADKKYKRELERKQKDIEPV